MKKGILNRSLLTTLVLPYFVYIYPNICKAETFSYGKFFSFLLIPVIIDLLLIQWKREPGKWRIIFSILFTSATVVFFYADFVVARMQHLLLNDDLYLRRRFLILILFSLFFMLQYAFSRKRELFNLFANRMLLIFSALLVFRAIQGSPYESDIKKIRPASVKIALPDTVKPKPILLIVLDEYTSPNQLYHTFKDSSVYSFSKYLGNSGWMLKDSMPSFEISTIHSISSLFNYNISQKEQYKKADGNLAAHFLKHALLTEFLQKKNIMLVNYSIFDVGNTKSFFPLYFVPEDFTHLFLSASIYIRMWTHMHHLDRETLDNHFYLSSYYNIQVVQKLKSILEEPVKANSFVYVHLYMPHEPIEYGNEINLTGYDIKNYFQYWKFTNQKILDIIKNAKALDRYRVIVTGDHAYRSSDKIDPKATFGAFYGFDGKSLSSVQSVQDIGSLIAAYFSK